MNNRTQAFIDRCRNQGFSPAGAFVLYQELNTIAAPTVLNEALATEAEKTLVAGMARLREALDAVQSPDDWKSYNQRWVSLLLNIEKPNIEDKKTAVRAWHQAWSTMIPQEDHSDFVSRMTAMNAPGAAHGVERYVDASEGMTWEQLQQVVQADRMAWTWHSAPTSGAREKDGVTTQDDALQAALADSAVRSVRWNWIDGDGPAQRSTIAQGLQQGQQEMRERTGWNGPVLGLNGTLRISFGTEHAATGYAMAQSDGSTLVCTSPQAGWGVISHEWFHAFDQMSAQQAGLHNGQCLSDAWSAASPINARGSDAQQQMAQAMNALLSTLITQAPGPQVREQGLIESQTSWGERMLKVYPWATSIVAEEQDRLQNGTWTRAVSSKTWSEGIEASGREPLESRTLAEIVVTEVEFLKTAQTANPSNPVERSVWREFLERFDDNILRHKLDQNYHGYFQLPAEVLAHSFEATFEQPAVSLTDVYAGEATLRYPTKAEGQWQAQAWRSFFAQAQAGWCEITGVTFNEAVSPTTSTTLDTSNDAQEPQKLVALITAGLPSLKSMGEQLVQRATIEAGNDREARAVARLERRVSSRM